MKYTIIDIIDFLLNIWERLFYFMLLMLIISMIGSMLIGLINMNIANIFASINLFIGIIPFAIDTVLLIILLLINFIIYG